MGEGAQRDEDGEDDREDDPDMDIQAPAFDPQVEDISPGVGRPCWVRRGVHESLRDSSEHVMHQRSELYPWSRVPSLLDETVNVGDRQ